MSNVPDFVKLFSKYTDENYFHNIEVKELKKFICIYCHKPYLAIGNPQTKQEDALSQDWIYYHLKTCTGYKAK